MSAVVAQRGSKIHLVRHCLGTRTMLVPDTYFQSKDPNADAPEATRRTNTSQGCNTRVSWSAKPKARRKEVHLGVFGWYDTQVCVLDRLPQILYPLPNLQPETLLCRASEANVAFLQMVKQSRFSNYAGFLNGSLWSVTISDAFLNR